MLALMRAALGKTSLRARRGNLAELARVIAAARSPRRRVPRDAKPATRIHPARRGWFAPPDVAKVKARRSAEPIGMIEIGHERQNRIPCSTTSTSHNHRLNVLNHPGETGRPAKIDTPKTPHRRPENAN